MKLNEPLIDPASGCLSASVTRYAGAQPIESVSQSVPAGTNAATVALGSSEWLVGWEFERAADDGSATDCTVTFRLVKGSLAQAGLGVHLTLHDWSVENYVLMPAAAYDGNRFRVSEQTYPPMLHLPDEIGPDIPTTITDVPRLSDTDGPSAIRLRSGDLSTPAVGVLHRSSGVGTLLLTDQASILGDHGISVDESPDRTTATITLSAPSMRPFQYSMCDTAHPSDDRAHDFLEGDETVIRFRLYQFPCADVPALMGRFAAVRKDLAGPSAARHEIPFSAAWDIVETKYNRDNWNDVDGFWRSSTSGHEIYGEWQTGWVGGAMNTHPMLLAGNDVSQERSRRTLDFLFGTVQAESGLFHGIFASGRLFGDNFRDHDDTDWLLLRKHADAVYFLGKQLSGLLALERDIPEPWLRGYERACDALVRIWEMHHQFGQFVHVTTGEILIGGSASVGIAPAALALAATILGRDDYLKVAHDAAIDFHDRCVSRGVTTGGPGEAVQCPDSESAFALLESFVVMYETTGDHEWVARAQDAAHLFATWCVSYDFDFPPTSEFAKLGLPSTGAVWANVQNKHAAPGICTHSGDALLKLFRATGNPVYLDLLRDIAHALPLFLSREDRPLARSFPPNSLRGALSPAGWMGERVNTSDWEGFEQVGGVDGGSCWCEVSLMLTWLEVPGVYVRPDTGIVCAMDHVDAALETGDNGRQLLRLTNPTDFPATLRLLVEDVESASIPMGHNAMLRWPTVCVPPKGQSVVEL